MLIGFWGTFGVGKTTAVGKLIANKAGYNLPDNLLVISADNARVWEVHDGEFANSGASDEDLWRGTQVAKLGLLDMMIYDRETIYLVESARWFSGMYEQVVASYRAAGGGCHFVIPVTTPEVMREFLIARCAKRNKAFREDYWTYKRMAYECNARYVNAAVKHFAPNRIPYTVFEIDAKRNNMPEVIIFMAELARQRVAKWYGSKHVDKIQR